MPSDSTRRNVLRTLAALSSTAVGGPVAARRPKSRVSDSSKPDDGGDDQPDIDWSHEFGSSGNDEPVDGVPAHDGGVVVLVAARGASEDIWVEKFGPSGEREWTWRFGTGRRNVARCILRTTDGYVIAGFSGQSYGFEPWLLGLAPDGTERWRQRYEELSGGHHLEALARRPDGGFVLGGYVDNGPGDENEAVWLMRTDGDGRKRWLRTYHGEFAWLTDITPTSQDGYALVGHSHVETPTGVSVTQATILSVDATGTERWRRSFGGAGSERLRRVLVTPTGYLVGGDTNSPVESGGLLMALDQRGRTIWQRVYPETGIFDVTPLSNGYAFVGRSRLVGTDSWGRVIWSVDVRGDPKTVTHLDGQLVVGARTAYRGQDVGAQAWVGAIVLQ